MYYIIFWLTFYTFYEILCMNSHYLYKKRDELFLMRFLLSIFAATGNRRVNYYREVPLCSQSLLVKINEQLFNRLIYLSCERKYFYGCVELLWLAQGFMLLKTGPYQHIQSNFFSTCRKSYEWSLKLMYILSLQNIQYCKNNKICSFNYSKIMYLQTYIYILDIFLCILL